MLSGQGLMASAEDSVRNSKAIGSSRNRMRRAMAQLNSLAFALPHFQTTLHFCNGQLLANLLE